MSDATPVISVLIVAYNAADLLPTCLDSLVANPPAQTYEVVCVDNASDDGTLAMLRDGYPWVRPIVSDRNLGFAGGNVLAATHAVGSLLLLLNPDTVILSGALDALTGALLADNARAIAGACLLGADGAPVTSWGDFPTVGWAIANTAPWGRAGIRARSRVRMDGTCADLTDVTGVSWVSGAALAIRRETWEAFGGMDTGYFLYYEETDLCFRVRSAGGEVVAVPDARIVHLEGASVGTQTVRQYVWSTRSLIRFIGRNRGSLAGAVVKHWVGDVNMLLWLVATIAGPFSPGLRERRERYAALARVGLGMRTAYDPPEVRP